MLITTARKQVALALALIDAAPARDLDRLYPDWYDWHDFLRNGNRAHAERAGEPVREAADLIAERPQTAAELERFIEAIRPAARRVTVGHRKPGESRPRIVTTRIAEDADPFHRPAALAQEFNALRVDLHWTPDGRHFTTHRLLWWDDASYIAHEADCGDREPERPESPRARSRCPRCGEAAGEFFSGVLCQVCAWTIASEPVQRRPLPGLCPFGGDTLSRIVSAVARVRRAYRLGAEMDALMGPLVAGTEDAEEEAARQAVWDGGMSVEAYNRALDARLGTGSLAWHLRADLGVRVREEEEDALPF